MKNNVCRLFVFLSVVAIVIIVLGKIFTFGNAIPIELQNLPYGIYPTSPTYHTVRFNFNKRFNVFPLAIFVPTTNTDSDQEGTNNKQCRRQGRS